MGKNYAVILSGCGPKDGSEIHESVSALMAIGHYGGKYQIFAPDIVQKHVIDHITDKEMEQSRNVLIESARIARGNVLPLSKLEANDYDAVIFPGGFGAAKNLFTFAFDGLSFTILPAIKNIVLAFYNSNKAIGAMCISPILIAKILKDRNITITLGPNTPLCKEVEDKFGAIVKESSASDAVVDVKNKVVTTPCYMCNNATPIIILEGAMKMINGIEKLSF